MVKNKHGGSKHKKYAKNKNQQPTKIDVKHLRKEPGQEYAWIKSKLGSCRMRVICFDKRERLALIRGKMKRRCWIQLSDIVLVSLRDFQDDKCDIIQKFTDDQVKVLVKNNIITEAFVKSGNAFEDYEYVEGSDGEVDDAADSLFQSSSAGAGTTSSLQSTALFEEGSAYTYEDFIKDTDSAASNNMLNLDDI